MIIWLVLSDEQMSKRWPFSLLNDEQMSNWVGVKHLPVMEEGDLKCSLILVVKFSWKHQLPGRMMKFSLRSPVFFGGAGKLEMNSKA